MITFLTIAQNEATNIRDCIESCRGLGVHLVIDGGSLDATQEIARKAGATVLERPFQDTATQYNYGLEMAETDWVFILDADERVGLELSTSIRLLLPGLTDTSHAGYWVSRRNYFWGQPLNYGGWYPDRNLRLLDRRKARYEERDVHARIVCRGTTGELMGDLTHLTYSSVSHYFSKMNDYTSREVIARAQQGASTERRARLKQLWLRTPFKPFSRLLYHFVLRRGYRDGRVGWDVAVLSAMYEWTVGLKSRESAGWDHRQGSR